MYVIISYILRQIFISDTETKILDCKMMTAK